MITTTTTTTAAAAAAAAAAAEYCTGRFLLPRLDVAKSHHRVADFPFQTTVGGGVTEVENYSPSHQ